LSTSTVLIRLASPTDSPVLAQLRYEFRAELDSVIEPTSVFLERCSSWMAQRLSSGSPWRCWTAIAAGSIVGTIWLQLVEKLPNPVGHLDSHGYISSVYVKPDCRGLGIGSDLLRECLRTCDAEAVDAVFLWPSAKSRGLYQRHGFVVSDDLLQRRRRSDRAPKYL
jgi:ribosomal protein S18 acetylase RimI-like enzyme